MVLCANENYLLHQEMSTTSSCNTTCVTATGPIRQHTHKPQYNNNNNNNNTPLTDCNLAAAAKI
jgi:hypothetical protein